MKAGQSDDGVMGRSLLLYMQLP